MIYSKTRNVLKYSELLLMFFVIGAGLFIIIWFRSAVTALEYNIASLEETKKEVLKERKELLAQRASLSSSHRIYELAVKRRGLGFPDRRYISLIKRNESPQVVSVRGTIKLDELFLDDFNFSHR